MYIKLSLHCILYGVVNVHSYVVNCVSNNAALADLCMIDSPAALVGLHSFCLFVHCFDDTLLINS